MTYKKEEVPAESDAGAAIREEQPFEKEGARAGESAAPVAGLSAPAAPEGKGTEEGTEVFARKAAPVETQEAEPGRPAPPRSFGAGLARSRQAAEAPAASGLRDEAAANRAQSLMALRSAALRMIAYQVSLQVEVKDFKAAKQRVEKVVAEAGGYIAHAQAAETPDRPQRASLTLRVPVEQMAAALEELRGLGRVVNEQVTSEEVTDQVVDLEARLRNSRATEERLVRVLKERTGEVADILQVEREIARTRQEIERMDAQRQNLVRRAALATISVTLVEEFQARLEPAPVGTRTRLRNAFVEGYQSFVGMFVGLALFFARHGLNLIFWSLVLWLGWRALARRLRPAVT